MYKERVAVLREELARHAHAAWHDLLVVDEGYKLPKHADYSYLLK